MDEFDIMNDAEDWQNAVYFYSATENPYGCFSNFSAHGFELGGKYWATVEHYFQAQKFEGTPHEDAIRTAANPKVAKSMGQDRKRPLRADWEKVKDTVMVRGVLAKFQTHTAIRQILLDTGDRLLVENAPSDYYWGIGQDGSGRNQLGKTLMAVRKQLRDQ